MRRDGKEGTGRGEGTWKPRGEKGTGEWGREVNSALVVDGIGVRGMGLVSMAGLSWKNACLPRCDL